MINMAIINFSSSEVVAVFLASLAAIAVSTFKVLRNEKGSAQILWLFGIYCMPPFIAIVYIVKHYFFQAANYSQAIKPS
jgi:hypothetical protein